MEWIICCSSNSVAFQKYTVKDHDPEQIEQHTGFEHLDDE